MLDGIILSRDYSSSTDYKVYLVTLNPIKQQSFLFLVAGLVCFGPECFLSGDLHSSTTREHGLWLRV